ncbi:MAG: hypothetical protein RLZZ555_822 [Pseudomonadota bacterium]|jgi:hypothetical protein
MATARTTKPAAASAAATVPADELAEGCVWMSLRDEDGATRYAQVHQPSGSVEVMAAAGWELVE